MTPLWNYILDDLCILHKSFYLYHVSINLSDAELRLTNG